MHELWSAREAADLLGYNPRTAQRVAEARKKQGDGGITKVGKIWVAPPAWWESALAQPGAKGRSRERNGRPLIESSRPQSHI